MTNTTDSQVRIARPARKHCKYGICFFLLDTNAVISFW